MNVWADLDPETASRLHPNDAFRIVRALEVITATGRKMSDQQHRHDFADCPYRILKICLERPREELYARIDPPSGSHAGPGAGSGSPGSRRRYPAKLKPLQSLGYRHVSAYLDEETEPGTTWWINSNGIRADMPNAS